jgi:two-component system, NarL family, response regulator DegU
MEKINVLLADDHHIVRDGIKTILENSGFINVLGEASNGLEAIEKVKELSPDILMIDISMPEMTGIEACNIVNQEKYKTKVLILSMHNSEEYIYKSLEAGAYGYMLKDSEKEELLMAIKKIHKGEKYYGASVSQIMMDSYKRMSTKQKPEQEDGQQLTKREKEILKEIVEGLSNKEIATKLFISQRTVDTHRSNLMQKMKVRNTAELVRLALQTKIT